MRNVWFNAFIVVLAIFPLQVTSLLSCLDEDGNPVDQWVDLTQNEDYQYYWHDGANGFLKSLYNTSQAANGNIMSTMSQFYSDDLDLNNVAYALYNDDPPPPGTTASSSFAHAKGVIITDDEVGFWLVHSKPNWPNGRAEGAAGFPDSSYAQSLMCITMNSTVFNGIASLQMVNYPYIYDSYMSTNLETLLPEFKLWIDNEKSTETNISQSVTSLDGSSYLQFAKSKNWGEDLYDDFVSPTLNESLYVETWRLGSGGRMGSICESSTDDTWELNPKDFEILEVESVMMPDGASWTGTQDHSKWAITLSSDDPVVCIGDVNRMCSQENRGGGAMCFYDDSNHYLWSSFNSAVASVEDCWAYNPCTGSSQCYWCPQESPVPTSFTTFAPTIPDDELQIAAGDIAISGFNADNPDSFSVVFLRDIYGGSEIKFTDKGWTGSSFTSSEGSIGFTATKAIPSGTVVVYDGVGTNTYGVWFKISGSFSLATSGDQILVYTGDASDPLFIYALSTTEWVNDSASVTSATSVLPNVITNSNLSASIVLADAEDGVYNGTKTGSAEELLISLINTSNWEAGDERYNLNNESFVVTTDTDDSSRSDPSRLTTGLLYTVIAGSVLFLCIIVSICWYWFTSSSLKQQAVQDNPDYKEVEIVNPTHTSNA